MMKPRGTKKKAQFLLSVILKHIQAIVFCFFFVFFCFVFWEGWGESHIVVNQQKQAQLSG